MKQFQDLSNISADSPLARAVQDFCIQEASKRSEKTRPVDWPSIDAWKQLSAVGTELWLDTGDMDLAQSLWCTEFRALTTNNTLLNREVQKGIYDALVPSAGKLIQQNLASIEKSHLLLELAFVLNAVHGSRLVKLFDTRVSIELHTDLANDIDASVEYGKRYHRICPEQFIIKIPLTAAGIVTARRLSDQGIPVNFTLGFSARQNLLIAAVAKPMYCNVFMGRINAILADNKLSNGVNAGEKATAASQLGLYRLREEGLSLTLQIGASLRGPSQVSALAGLDVYTMPPAVAKGFLDEDLAKAGLANRLESKFDHKFNDGVDVSGTRLEVFWTEDDQVESAARALASVDVAALDADSVCQVLNDNGCMDFFPELSSEEEQRIAKDGKIPNFAAWRQEVMNGRLAWDTLLTLAGLASFATDQACLDKRIEKHLF